jgi:hypothetical protein
MGHGTPSRPTDPSPTAALPAECVNDFETPFVPRSRRSATPPGAWTVSAMNTRCFVCERLVSKQDARLFASSVLMKWRDFLRNVPKDAALNGSATMSTCPGQP